MINSNIYFLLKDWLFTYHANTVRKLLHIPNVEIKTKRYTDSPFSDADVEESYYFVNAELKIPHQQLLIFVSLMNTLFQN